MAHDPVRRAADCAQTITCVTLISLLVVGACGSSSLLLMNALAGTPKAGISVVSTWLGSMANIACMLAGVPPILFPVLLFFFAVYDAWERRAKDKDKDSATAATTGTGPSTSPPRVPQSYKDALLSPDTPN